MFGFEMMFYAYTTLNFVFGSGDDCPLKQLSEEG